ncbi:MAG TPA: hypothetical protein VGK67_16220 [Myxococcales bacterium]
MASSPTESASLTPGAREVLERARSMPLSYGVRLLAAPGDGESRLVVVLGEAHLKLGKASALGKEIVGQFELRGVETFQTRQVLAGRALWLLIYLPRLLLRVLSLGLVKGSTITDAKALPSGHTVEIEKAGSIPLALHATSLYLTALFLVLFAQIAVSAFGVFVPALAYAVVAFEVHFLALLPALLLRRRSWSWLIHPAVGLVTTRDPIMAEGTVRMLREHPGTAPALVIMGRAHLPGYERELVEKHGFRRVAG